MIFEVGKYKLDINIARTRKFYENEAYESCDCDGCRNFAQAYSMIPDTVQAFFQQFGIDLGKPAEMTAYVSHDGNMTLYGGFYHICGTILDGPEPFIQVAKRHFQLDEEATIRFSSDYFVYFTNECSLVEKDFPSPVIQLEMQGSLPWVLDVPNPYHYTDT